MSALPGSQSEKHQKNQTHPPRNTPSTWTDLRAWRAPHRCCRLCCHIPATHQPLSIACTQLSPMHLTCPKQETAMILKFVLTANKIKHGRAGKEPTLTSQVTRRITRVPAETWVLLCSWLSDPQPSLSKRLQRLDNWKQTCTDHNRKLGFFPYFFTAVRNESVPQKAVMRSPLPISPILCLPSQLLHVLSRAFSTPHFPLPPVLLHNHSTVVSKTPWLKTRKQKPSAREVAMQLLWIVYNRTQPPFSCCCLKPSPGRMSYHFRQTKVISQLQAGRSSL